MFKGFKTEKKWYSPLKTLYAVGVFFAIWYGGVYIFDVPQYLLPSPDAVVISIYKNYTGLFKDAKITGIEIILGFILGSGLGIVSGLLLEVYPRLRRWFLPVLVISQTIPIYAIAPLLVLWLGFDMAPKVVMAVIIIFFPVTTAFYDGLRRTPQGWIDMARITGANKWQILYKVKFPASLPDLISGLRVAAAFAPIGAIVGEWVGASAGLGYRMIYFNARMRTADMFGALIILICMALLLYFTVDILGKKMIKWKKDA